ncbi:ABC transporter substrate-binding protein [Elioraea sp.]|jgi:peptide/nickel transport system substrate-binding protein|uniref:ABC transporter substrate-binding protein n=1 Tax=Elioraea sp. TaxID=2185103 RepID=UPI0021DBEC79|nr:ABC transporter substrate-binding protein [Elioraea sp.]GIX10802.1 MAG: ABC transporter substrate-binding protein [Elioraea sp.]
MKRRTFLGAAAGATAAATIGLARPALAQGAARVLRFAPQANLANFDPIWGTQYVVRNAAALVWDTLYGVDSKLAPKRQMVEGEEHDAEFKIWTFRLREGLKFHDGEPVRARDVVQSLLRWMPRDPMGQLIRARMDALEALDDRTFRYRLNKPFPKMVFALGKNNTPMSFIMPERIARTDPFQQITEIVGSGPMRFKRDEWVPGSRAVFERFADYVAREEPADWLSGGKRIHFDRIEWHILPDPATAAAALQNGEIDWWETPLPDLVPILKRNRNVMVDIADPLGNIGSFRMNHLHPPFNDVRARRAIQMALNQEDYMRAIVGSDDALWRRLPSFFTPGTPAYTEAGGEVLKGARDIEGAKRLLREAGYDGQPITVLVAQDQPPLKAMGEVTNALLRSLGMNVDFVATDWGTVGQRRALKTPPGQGGWHIFHTWHAGADCIAPASYNAIRGNGDGAWFGWPTSAKTEVAVEQWLNAATPEQERAAYDAINAAAMADVIYVPTGFYLGYQAWRRTITGIQKGPLPFFWDVRKA